MMPETEVFFESGRPLAETAAEISDLLNIKLNRAENAQISHVRYEGASLCLEVLLYNDHEHEDDDIDPRMKFSRYTYVLKFINGYRGYEENGVLRQAMARLAFVLITDRLRYPAMLIEDMQQLVAISPAGATVPSA